MYLVNIDISYTANFGLLRPSHKPFTYVVLSWFRSHDLKQENTNNSKKYNSKELGSQKKNIFMFYIETYFLKNLHNLFFLVIFRKAQCGENCKRNKITKVM